MPGAQRGATEASSHTKVLSRQEILLRVSFFSSVLRVTGCKGNVHMSAAVPEQKKGSKFMSEQTKPVSKPDDQTTKAKPARTELSQEELDRVSGGFKPGGRETL
jgi:hypothetical protein